jgi:hypothetical protein
MKLKKYFLLWNYWANLNQTLLKWSLGGSLPQMCPVIPTSSQAGVDEGRQTKSDDNSSHGVKARCAKKGIYVKLLFAM